jgi:hypothetical protein
LFRSCGRNFQDFDGQVITLCGLRLKFAWQAIILVAIDARRHQRLELWVRMTRLRVGRLLGWGRGFALE